MVQSPLLGHIQHFLDEYVSKIPTHSTIDLALKKINEMSLQEKKKIHLPQNAGVHDYNGPVAIYSGPGFDWKEKTIAICAFRSVVTYLALQALGYVSLCLNGAVGGGKIALGFIVSSADQEKAKKLFQEGFYQVLTAIYDYAIVQFGFICVTFSLVEGGWPEQAEIIHSKIFQAYKPSQPPHPSQEEGQPDDICLLQQMGNALQEMVLQTPPQK